MVSLLNVNVNGSNIFYRQAGNGDPVVLLHGSHRSSYIWMRNITRLSEYFSVYAPDRPGYGQSVSIGESDPLPDMVEFAHSFLLSIGHQRANWIGESRGGGIAIELATRYPASINKLVLVSSIGLPPNELPKPAEIETRSKWEWFIERSFENPDVVDDELRENILADLEKAAIYERRRLSIVQAQYNERGLLDEIVQLSCPTYLVWGRQDPVFPVECVERFRQLTPSLEGFAIIDNARHLPNFEHAEQFNEIVLKFLIS